MCSKQKRADPDPVDILIGGLSNSFYLPWVFFCLARVDQTLDSAIHRINHYPADKYYGNQLRYPLDSDLSGG